MGVFSFIAKMWRDMFGLADLKWGCARAKGVGEQTQAYVRCEIGKEVSQCGTATMERQQILSQQVPPGPQAAPVAQKAATPHGQPSSPLPCPQCGQLVPPGATFCAHCGTLLVASESGWHVCLDRPASPPLVTPVSSAGHHASAKSAQSSVPVMQQPLPSPLPSTPCSASSASDATTSQLSSRQPGSGQAEVPGTASSYEVQSLSDSKLSLIVGTCSHPGITRRHKPNEDSLFAAQGMRAHHAQPFGLFIVADGMGGHAHGQEASRLAIQTMIDRMLPQVSGCSELHDADCRQLLIEGVQVANGAIHQRNTEQRTDMGTTITAALVVGLTAFVVNVGDSRTYLYRASEGLRKVTQDHSVVAYLVEAGIIHPDDVYTHPQRNRIYRSLGAKPVIQVDAFTEQLQPDDTLLLCSDGLWEMVHDPGMLQILQHGADPSQMSQLLIEAALEGGGVDNISMIVVQVTQAMGYTAVHGMQLLAKPETVEMPNLSQCEPKQSSRE
jgi:serine/threonine protein phosphatase PrpC